MTEPPVEPDWLETLVFAKMAALATCLCAEIERRGLPSPCFCGILPGEVVYDATGFGECDDADGQAWVRLTGAYASQQVGVPDETPGNCSKGLGVDLEVGILRYFPYEENGGVLPPDVVLAVAQLQMADMMAMKAAIECCNDLGDSKSIILGSYLPDGPLGGLVGGKWSLSISVDF